MATFEFENACFRYLKYRQTWPIGHAIGVPKSERVVRICAVRCDIMFPYVNLRMYVHVETLALRATENASASPTYSNPQFVSTRADAGLS